jgi:hypothetical protein
MLVRRGDHMTLLLAGCAFWLGFWAGYLWQTHHADLEALIDATREAAGLRDPQEARGRPGCLMCSWDGITPGTCAGAPRPCAPSRDPQEARERLWTAAEEQAWEDQVNQP